MPADPPFRWLGHSTVLLPGPPCVVIDPWRWRLDACADYVLTTHDHVDHRSPADIRAAALPDARVFHADGTLLDVPVRPADEALTIRTLPAEGPIRDGAPCGFHVRGEGVSFLVTIGAHTYLHLGDSRGLPEHAGLAPDVAFIPAGGMTVMDADEAAEAAVEIGARLSVPIHWGDLNGRFDVARRFVATCAERGLRAGLEPGAAP